MPSFRLLGEDYGFYATLNTRRRVLSPVLDTCEAGKPDLLEAVEQIENRRQAQKDTEVIYLLSPEPHIVDCLMADFEKRKYRRATLLWTGSEFFHAVSEEYLHSHEKSFLLSYENV